MKVSRKKIEANRRNARKSTGPKSAAGKKRVSGNAAKHMLNVPPPHELVRKWFRIIMDDPHAEPDLADFGARQRATILYAQARAQVERARRHEANVISSVMDLQAGIEDSKAPPGYGNEKHSADPELLEDNERALEMIRKELEPAARYRRQAESRARKLFRRWCEFQNSDSGETNPNRDFVETNPNW